MVRSLEPGQVLKVVTDDVAAREDLGSWCRMTGNDLIDRIKGEGCELLHPARRGDVKDEARHGCTAGCRSRPEAACADLLIRLVRTIRPLPAGSILEVVAYSRSARHDIPAWCRLTGNRLLHVGTAQPTRFFIRKGET